ncbi:MAG: hypothetical protein Q7O66_07455 [Dehalococcoidia bacterium]|nr:hypothetical protein [Dehalococcoidia bacterium]
MSDVERMVLVPARLITELADWYNDDPTVPAFDSAKASAMWDEVRALAKEAKL